MGLKDVYPFGLNLGTSTGQPINLCKQKVDKENDARCHNPRRTGHAHLACTLQVSLVPVLKKTMEDFDEFAHKTLAWLHYIVRQAWVLIQDTEHSWTRHARQVLVKQGRC